MGRPGRDPLPYGERRCNNQVIVAASGLQTELASRAGLEDELSKLDAQKLAPRRTPANLNAPLRMTAPSRWISHDFPIARRSP